MICGENTLQKSYIHRKKILKQTHLHTHTKKKNEILGFFIGGTIYDMPRFHDNTSQKNYVRRKKTFEQTHKRTRQKKK